MNWHTKNYNSSEDFWEHPCSDGVQKLDLNNGIKVYLLDSEFKEKTAVREPVMDSCMRFSILVSGESKTGIAVSEKETDFKAGDCIISHTPYIWNEYFPDQRIVQIFIYLPLELSDRFIDDTSIREALFLDDILKGKNINSYYLTTKVSPKTRILINEIFQNPYRGTFNKFFIEGKVLEIAALQLGVLTERDRISALPVKDIDRIFFARDLLLRDISNPTSIVDLSLEAGINEFKLKKGFKKVFGTTVFGYLRDVRMEQAYYLLGSGEKSVIEIAFTVGYSNPGYFASQFRKKYGVNPGEYLLSVRKGKF